MELELLIKKKGSDDVAEKGWIKLHRKVLDCWIWSDKPYDKARAWIDLLLLAMHHEKKIISEEKFITVPRGSYMTSVLKLSERWGWSRNKVKRFLDLLEREKMLKTNRTNTGTLVTIVNYEVYQIDNLPSEPTDEPINEPVNEPTTEPPSEPTDEPQNKNVKNVKNERKNTFCPPTVDEVREYIQTVGSKVDPEAFVAFYESKGWLVGKSKMKSWKAAITTWEKRNGLKRELPKKKEDIPQEEIYEGDDW